DPARRFLLRCAPLTRPNTCYTSSVILGLGVSPIRRREFIAIVGSSLAGWPLAARAQQPAMPVIGYLGAGASGPLRQQIATFHAGLKEAGFIEGHNLAVEYRFAEGQYDRLPALAADLVRRQVALLFATSNDGVSAAKQATAAIPIVFAIGGDPVALGFVARGRRSDELRNCPC